MNAQNAKDFLPLVQALADGKTLQWVSEVPPCFWRDVNEVHFGDPPGRYRIKPEPRRWWIVKYSEHDHHIAFTHNAAHTMAANAPCGLRAEIIEVVEVLK